MDWLTLGLLLLTVASNIEAQQGYNYPRPKTPFPSGDASTNLGLGSQSDLATGTQRPSGTQQPFGTPSGVPTGTQRPFGGSQQPSVGYTPGEPTGTFGTNQPSGGYSVGGQTGTPSGTSSTFGSSQPSSGTPSGSQRPFGAQPTGGYSTVGPSGATSGTFGTSSGTQGPFGAQQPSNGYPSAGSVTPSGTLGTQQPSGGYPTQTGTSSGVQRPFGTQGQSGQQTFGSQQPLTGLQQPGVSDERRFGSQTPSTTYPGQSFGTQQPGRSGAGRQIDFQPSGVDGATTGLSGGRPQGTTSSSTGSQQGYSYPSPQEQLSGVGQSGTIGGGISSGSRPGADGAGTFGTSGQRPSISSGVERPSGASGFPGSTQFSSDREGVSGSQGYTRPGLEKPVGTSQQAVGGYSGTGQPQSSSPSGASGAQYPSSNGQPQGFADKRGRGDFSGEERPGAFPAGQTGYTGSQGSQIPSQGVTKPSGRFSGQVQGYPRSQEPASSQFPTGSSGQGSVPSERPGFAGRTTQFPSNGVQLPSGASGSQITSGFPSTTTSGQTSTVGRPSRPQFPSGSSTTSQDKPSSTGFQSYLPPEQPGTGGLPLAEVPSSQFPSDGFTSTGSRSQAGYQRPSGGIEQPTQPQTSYDRSGLSAVSQGPSGVLRQPTRAQSGRSDTSNEYQRPSGVVDQSIEPQTGYSRPGVDSVAQTPSGQSTQNGYGRPDLATGPQRPSGTSGQSTQPQTGYSRPGVSSVSQGPSGVTGQPAQSQNGYGRPDISTGSQRPSGTSGPSTPSQSGYSRPGAPSVSQGPSGVSGQPGQSQNGYSSPDVSSGYQGPSGVAGKPGLTQNEYRQPDVGTGGISIGQKPSGSGTPSTFQQPTGSQNGYGVSGTTLPGSQFPSGQPSRTSTGQDASLTPTEGDTRGRPFGVQSPSADGQVGSRPEQGTAGFGKPSSTAQEFGRPGSAGRSEPGYSLDQAVQEGFPRRTGGRTLPGFQQDTRNFIPGQQEPSDDGSYVEEEGDGDFSAIPGQPGRDYPILAEVPETSFDCDDQEFRGYYADVETRCQIFHICANNKTYDFICPNGTIFHQENLVCVWWDQFDCETAPSLYRINEHIYDFSIFGAQQTGGIPFPGQEYPEFQGGQQGFPLGRTPGAGIGGQGPQGAVSGSSFARPGYPTYPNQRPGSPRLEDGYPSDGIQAPSGSSTTPSGGQQGYQGPSGAFPRPGGYPTVTPQGTPSSSSSGYPSNAPQGTGTYQGPTGVSQVSGNGLQGPAGQYQGLSGGYQRPGGAVQRPGEEPQTPTGSGVSGYPSGRGGQPQVQGFPTGPGAALEQRPFGRGGKSRPIFPTGSQSTVPSVGQQPEEGSGPQKDGRYPTGTSTRPAGFPQTPGPSEEGSRFPGSPQPHQPTREYLPAV